MLPAMRSPALAGWSIVAAFALIGAAVLATAWSTRSTVVEASAAVRSGQALAVEQSVRADLADVGHPPTAYDLAAILHDHDADGLRYIASLEHGRIEDEAGKPLGSDLDPSIHGHAGAGPTRHVATVGDRVRVESRLPFRRAWGEGGHAWWVVMEIEPVEAEALRAAATRNLEIGTLAALTLLGVAIAMVRRELNRRAEDHARERERRLASLGEMSAVLAHEIKNPLASLKGNAQLLVGMLPQGEKPRAKAERVVDEAQRLEQLTQDLLAFAKHGEIKREVTDIGELLASCAQDGVTIETPPGAVRWPIDRERMHQVISNLIANAVHAGPPVRACATIERDRLVVAVADRGPGVPEADREKIFEPFYTNKTHGTGLGLSVARRIVVLHGGTIGVSVDPAGGAVFRVEIPR